jgi:hypothetical protein
MLGTVLRASHIDLGAFNVLFKCAGEHCTHRAEGVLNPCHWNQPLEPALPVKNTLIDVKKHQPGKTKQEQKLTLI